MSELHDDLDFGISLGPSDAKVQQTLQTKQKQKAQSPAPQNHPTNSSDDNVYQKNTISTNDMNLSLAAHPSICVATFAFKACSILMYFPLGYFMSTILMFIFVLVLSAIDFWVVKNISGRLLVGLRWRSYYDQKGKEQWKFQSYDKGFQTNRADKLFFWGAQLGSTLIWGFFLIINVLGLNFFNVTLIFICASLSFTNLYGYYKCRGQHHKKLKDLKSQYGAKGLMKIAGGFL